MGLVVIPSEARDLLFRHLRKKADSWANPDLGMTSLESFRKLFSGIPAIREQAI
jgi:hypothetical protein